MLYIVRQVVSLLLFPAAPKYIEKIAGYDIILWSVLEESGLN